METIEKWIAEEKECYVEYEMEIKNRSDELKAKYKLEVFMAKLEISGKRLKVYTEMLSETSHQEGRLWGEDPAVEWVHHMRNRWWEHQGAVLDQKLVDAYEKEHKMMQQSLEDLTSSFGWSTVGTDEAPDVSPEQVK